MRTKLILLWSLFSIPLVLSSSFVGESHAQGAINAAQLAANELDPETAAELEEIGRQISATTMSPFCPGRTISACPSGQARELREQIIVWLKQGLTPEGVRNRLIITYGEEVRGAPRAEGVGLMAWIVPVVFIILLAAVVAIVLFYLRSRSIIAKESADEEDVIVEDAMQQRIAEELKARRNS